MGALKIKPGVTLSPMTVGGACIIGALFRVASRLPYDLVVTSGTDGAHSGPTDPHHRGAAYDVRTHDMPNTEAHTVLRLVMGYLAEFTHEVGGNPELVAASIGVATELFYGQLENEGLLSEHLHLQVRNGHTFPPSPPRSEGIPV